uniref:Uncharacterized protein n=1 Tax=uncultured gamma proteobacterium HF0010_01E20 TaxID=710977 RepID=E0XQB3_9GAMM|nr:hypothetical protein [uncultured gamma proteobacterium HF0010_01E20]
MYMGFKLIPPIGSAYFYFYFLNFSYVSKAWDGHSIQHMLPPGVLLP